MVLKSALRDAFTICPTTSRKTLSPGAKVKPFLTCISSLAGLPLVADVRSVGLVGCVECQIDTSLPQATEADKRLGAKIDAHCIELGLIVRPIGNMCVMSPPLIITREQIDDMVEMLREGILRTAAEIATGS